ncbi:MAG: hypothetical protein HOH04_02295 [Rhodospirillaceae bacterium]|nr:hypothetical protein [Rhodospirillaceae bacterium]
MILAAAPVRSETLTLVTAANTVDTLTSEVIVREAYKRLGIDVEIKKFPGERALKMANDGKVAGDVQRIDKLSAKYPNLVQIKPAINYIEASAFASDPSLSALTWAELKPYRIGIIRGIKFAEGGTQGMDRYLASDYAGLFKMLHKKRVDVAVSPSLNGRYQMQTLGINGISELRPAIARFDLFHYVHVKNAALAPKLSAVFTDMQQAGQLNAIRDHVIGKLLEPASKAKDKCLHDYACLERGLTFLTAR